MGVETQHAGTQQIKVFTARQLETAVLPDLRWIVQDMLPEGLAILSAPPKSGKSWLCLQLAAAATQGEDFLGHQTEQCGVLYLALEDGKRRLQKRQESFFEAGRAAGDLFYITDLRARLIGQGLEEMLAAFIEAHESVRLVVIDVFARAAAPVSAKQNVYEQDYQRLAGLKRLADQKHVCLLLVTHTRKQRDDSDWLNATSGSTGLTGSADTLLSIERQRRNDAVAVLHLSGRDVEMCDLQIRREGTRWVPADPALSDPEARRDALILAIAERLLEVHPDGFTGPATAMLAECGGLEGIGLLTGAGLSRELADASGLLAAYGIGIARQSRTSRNWRLWRTQGGEKV